MKESPYMNDIYSTSLYALSCIFRRPDSANNIRHRKTASLSADMDVHRSEGGSVNSGTDRI